MFVRSSRICFVSSLERNPSEAVLAHVRPGIKGVYDLHDYMDEKREALQLWGSQLQSIVNPQPSNVVKLRA
jgi:poly-beta-hydroxyalkanoate depolymerase